MNGGTVKVKDAGFGNGTILSHENSIIIMKSIMTLTCEGNKPLCLSLTMPKALSDCNESMYLAAAYLLNDVVSRL